MSAPRKLATTNLSLEDLRMDDRGIKDPRYYCLPPNRTRGKTAEAKAGIGRYPDNSNQGCFSEEECIEVWQRLCLLGVHPHPVDPAGFDLPSVSAAAFTNTSPRRSAPASGAPRLKREEKPDPVGKKPELLADLPTLPAASPSRAPRQSRHEANPHVNFAIGGSGVIRAARDERTEQRYREMQQRGEEPDLLVTRSFARAALFAMDDEEGKKPWVHGTKVVFFEARANAYLAVAEIKATGAFYEKVAHNGQDVADDVDEDEDVNEVPAEEAEEHAEYFKLLKTKIGAWYNGKYGGSVEGKKKRVSFKTLFDKPELNPPAPAKPRVIHFYSRRFYHERVKDRVTAHWAALGHLENRPKEITVRNAVTKECWEAEPEAFKEEVRAALESEHQAAKDVYVIATSGETPKTPGEYDIALSNAACSRLQTQPTNTLE
ncbi:hypothetical protein B0H14DRAFT_3525879 [Mycena olivaceomarginata]|nr:hypothetical protein B0H14DRAFT_3525879 [Mycena olivaceomarginata]